MNIKPNQKVQLQQDITGTTTDNEEYFEIPALTEGIVKDNNSGVLLIQWNGNFGYDSFDQATLKLLPDQAYLNYESTEVFIKLI